MEKHREKQTGPNTGSASVRKPLCKIVRLPTKEIFILISFINNGDKETKLCF